MNGLFETNMALRCEVKSLKRVIEEFKSGKRYLKIQEDHKRITAGYVREIKRLKAELAASHAQAVTARDMWMDECDRIWQEHLAEIARKDEKIRRLEDKIWETRMECDERAASVTRDYEDRIFEKDRIIDELRDRLAHAEALLGRDSTNTSLPTGQTPPGKKKHIPNGRRNSGKNKGGQPGHERHMLEKPSADDVTDETDHPLKDGEICPSCGSENLVYTGEHEEKYEVDIEIRVKKVLHKFWICQCDDCGELVRTGIDPGLRAECQYGPVVQAVALSLMNTANAAINKVPVHLSGITGGEIMPSEGYVAKLVPRAAKGLGLFMDGLFGLLITRRLVYWDDTVVMADKKRICLRFYGDDTIAYYVAHDNKDMAGVIEDGVLDALTGETAVMHDHNSINYNGRFAFKNIECNAHLQRDLQKIIDETGHAEPRELKELISATIKDRNDLAAKGGDAFSDRYVQCFHEKLDAILDKADKTAEGNTSKYSGPFERAVIRRLHEYKENYFAWVNDFGIPTTNNLSERALRGVKTKMKVSGQFASSKTANNYARVRTYIETCRRNGINEITALSRLCAGNPYTVEEIFSTA